ncbi:HNH endonuclease [Geomonas nitrogeniifigens]|uniref:HNH endonuclease n=1 Tax=Geomonas diazotrophica TaxID=2843197 RepID=A0ABX8JNP7_9BACT|nr:HNH endonuclease signature motif containing protein [Geomonas nitrogeniifigens]QWV98232.1 HNH endonuclease [Geomonas nitrogeniifigens]
MEHQFLKSALGEPETVWDGSALGFLSSLFVPDSILGRKKALLRADVNEQWAKWFVEGISDPRRYAEQQTSYPFVFKDVYSVIDDRFTDLTKSEKQEIASIASRTIYNLVDTYRLDRKRKSIPRSERTLLVEISGGKPRCWICGAKFSQDSIDNFILGETRSIPLPRFVDILKPRGLNQRDMAIEVDHVVPHAHGGGNENNLRLSCGWCNMNKSAFISIYDIEGMPKRSGSNDLGIHSLPRPFWAVRLLATGKNCEYKDGCQKTSLTSELTIAPISANGAMNPSNLKITCYDHDSFNVKRFQPPQKVKAIWRFK